MKFRPFAREFYLPSAREVAPLLLGHWLLRWGEEGFRGGTIVETEAYLSDDPACHAAVGKTARNRVMWGNPGLAYVYLIYGYHYCVNAVCCPEGMAEAVLIRAIRPDFAPDILRKRRPGHSLENVANGPAKLCQALEITRELDGADLCDLKSGVVIAENPDRGALVAALGPIVATPRIGITRAAEVPLRFCLANSGHLSRKIKRA